MKEENNKTPAKPTIEIENGNSLKEEEK